MFYQTGIIACINTSTLIKSGKIEARWEEQF